MIGGLNQELLDRSLGLRESPLPRTATLLLVDNDRLLRESLGRRLVHRGYRVRFADGGSAALEALEVPGVDLVILDVLMPGMDGMETCRRLRNLPFGSEVPVLILTGDCHEGLEEKVIACGADDLLRKPVPFPELLVRVNALLRMGALLAALREKAELIQLQHEQLEAACQERDRLNAFLLHDLKHPLGTLHLQAELALRDAGLRVRDREAWSRVRETTARASGLLATWLDAALLVGEMDLKPTRIAPDEWEASLRGSVEPWLSAKGLRFYFRCEEAVPSLLVDRAAMERVFLNLLDNAIAHSPRGGKLGLEFLHPRTEVVQIVISDEGPGIPFHLRERVFDEGVSLREAGLGNERHQGLGLSFCRMVVEAHGGRIWADAPMQGSGTCLVIELPVRVE